MHSLKQVKSVRLFNTEIMEWCVQSKNHQMHRKVSLKCSFPKATEIPENQVLLSIFLLSTTMGHCSAYQNVLTKQIDYI